MTEYAQIPPQEKEILAENLPIGSWVRIRSSKDSIIKEVFAVRHVKKNKLIVVEEIFTEDYERIPASDILEIRKPLEEKETDATQPSMAKKPTVPNSKAKIPDTSPYCIGAVFTMRELVDAKKPSAGLQDFFYIRTNDQTPGREDQYLYIGKGRLTSDIKDAIVWHMSIMPTVKKWVTTRVLNAQKPLAFCRASSDEVLVGCAIRELC